MNFITRLILFLIVNFGALYLGNILQGAGPMSEWYQGLNIAPWTPPGWVFGAAWTLIMICFSFYMALLVKEKGWNAVLPLFLIQLVLNIIWNPVFFRYEMVIPALVIISLLAIVVFTFLGKYREQLGAKSILIFPYCIWLCIAISLNAYVLLNN